MPYNMCQDDKGVYEEKPIASSIRYPSQSSSIHLDSESDDVCRICHGEGAADLPLIAPCYCCGSVKYVHQTCLQQWIKLSNKRNCELCKFEFIIGMKMKPFNEWHCLVMTELERKRLWNAVLRWTVVCFYVPAVIALTLVAAQLKDRLWWPFWIFPIVLGMGSLYAIFYMFKRCKVDFMFCQRWIAHNKTIYIHEIPIESNETSNM